MVLIPTSHSPTTKNENMGIKVGYKILHLDLWKILDGPDYGRPTIFHQYNYSEIISKE